MSDLVPGRVTVIVPVLNEEAHIEGCLTAIVDQDVDPEAVEILVVDGGSVDATPALATAVLNDAALTGRVIANRPGDRPSNLNRGLAEATGEFLVRVDARSRLPRHYVGRAVATLQARPDVMVVGGRQVARLDGGGPVAEGIARALNNRWATGLARYRRAATSGPADTVYLGVFRTADVRAAGGWSADLAVNEDFDLNRRLTRRGGIVWFDPDLSVGYLPRTSLTALLRQYHSFGRWKGYYWRTSDDRPRLRQWALLAGPAVATSLAVAGLRARSPWPAVTVSVAVAGSLVVEIGGNTDPARPVAHLTGVAAIAAIAGGWLSGVARGVLQPADGH